MSLTKEKKSELIGKYGRADGDTGSAEVQVALLTERINELTEHLRDAQQRPPLAPRPADAGRQAPPHAALPRAHRPRALPRPGRRPRPAAMIAAGEPAPDFTLRDQDGEEVSLADFRGRKVLLVFYPVDFSPVCARPALALPGGQAGDRRQGRRAGRDQRRQLLRPQGLPGEARDRHHPALRLRAQGRGRPRLRLLPRRPGLRQPHPRPRSTRRARSPGPTNRPTRASSPAPTSSSTRSPSACRDRPRPAPPVPPIGPDDHVRGEGEGLIVYADLGCPHCAAAWAEIVGAPGPDRLPPLPGRQQAPALAGPARGRRGGRDARAGSSRWSTRSTPTAARSTTRTCGSGPSASGSTSSASRRDRRSDAIVAARVRRDFRVRHPRRGRRHASGFRCRVPSLAVKENESSESRWPPTGRPEVGQLNEHV